MTISQSRFGGNAEVGRNSTRKRPQDDRAVWGIPAGTALAGAGWAGDRIGTHVQAQARQADAIRRKADSELGRLQRHWNNGRPTVPATGMTANKAKHVQAMKDAAARRDANSLLHSKLAPRARRIRLGSNVAMGAGALGIAGALIATEAKRGTANSKRPTLAEIRQGQGNQRRAQIEQAKASGDRYRAMALGA